ncbi:MAG: Lipase [uncultured Thiotrichaceae bacterium]|uniref:Lipase n=1 Tax=uncultured Thiotrichaceae bacterium TaxID=298394 RepID=A0A6S6S864_9GAMM|nr:MAG: Lipase [uncultured Thiotrichaceae bacterium]
MMNKKYQQQLGQDVLAYIKEVESVSPVDAVSLTVEKQREVYLELSRHFHAGHPEGISTIDSIIKAPEQSIPIRHYQSAKQPAKAHIIYYHGGGFVIGNLDSHDDVCAEFCDQTGFEVTAVDYRLSPENTHPAAFNDALAAFEHIAATTDLPIMLVGDSAGATLAAAVAHATRQHDVKPVGQVLIYPALGGDMTRGSYLEYADAPMLTTDDMVFYYQAISGGSEMSHDPTFLPLMDTDYSGLPLTYIFTAQCDPLRDDGRDYQQRILAAGGRVEWVDEMGLVHGYLRARHSVECARDSFGRMVAALLSALP